MIDIPQGHHAQAAGMQFLLQQSQKLDFTQAQKKQQQSLQKILHHAIATVPYYQLHLKHLTQKKNFSWQDIPLLNRQQLQENHAQLISNNDLKGHGKNIDFRSSGSTGRPVHIISTEYAQQYWQAITLRDHLWSERDFSLSFAVIKNMPKDKGAYPGYSGNSWGPSSSSIFQTGPSYSLNSSETIATQYQWLTEKQPAYLVTYPSVLQELVKLQLEHGKIKSLRNISTLGETLNAETRKLVHKAFSCKTYDMYSAQEVGYIALQCPKHEHYHIQSENCLVEILDENNKPCSPGKIGRVVVTSLHNYRMPLIRYEIGDFAIAGNTCDCGITLPVIERILGRHRNLVIYPNGEKSWPSYNPMKLMEIFPNAQFQLIQISLTQLELRINTTSVLQISQIEDAQEVIRKAIGYDFDILIQTVDSIERAASGKFEEFICRVNNV